jgi:serine/threonine protein kinase
VLIDLGGARRFRELNPRPGSGGLAPALTPLYAPPEVIPGLWDEAAQRERSHFTPWIDSYAFGLTLYQLVTGREPYDHLAAPPDAALASIAAAKRAERDGEHRAVSRAALDAVDWSDTDVRDTTTAALTERLWDLLQRATHVEPARRATARQLRDALAALLGVIPRPPGEPGARDWVQRRLANHAFEGRLARLARSGGPTASLGKLRRGAKEFWEEQGFRPPGP